MVLRVFGDSIADGSGADPFSTNSWRALLSSRLESNIVSYAHGGDMWADQADEVYSVYANSGDISMIQLGVNDQRIYGTDVTKRGYYKLGMQALITWLAIGNKQTARSVTSNETGVWEDTAVYGIGRCARTAGSTKTFTVSGTTIYIAHIISKGTYGPAGAFDVKIDGVTMGSYTTMCDPELITYNGVPHGPRLLRYSGLPSGSHTVEIIVTASDRVYIDWVSGNEQSVKPRVLVANTILPYDYRWGGSEQNIQDYNAVLNDVVNQLISDGLNIELVDLYSIINPNTDITFDALHPNNIGHSKIATSFEDKINAYTYSQTQITKRSDNTYFLNDLPMSTHF